MADGTVMLRPIRNKVGDKDAVNKNQYLMTSDGRVSRLRSEDDERTDENWTVVRQGDLSK